MKKFDFKNSKFLIFFTLFFVLIGIVLLTFFILSEAVVCKKESMPPIKMPKIKEEQSPHITAQPKACKKNVREITRRKKVQLSTPVIIQEELEENEAIEFGAGGVEGGVEGGIEGGVVSGVIGGVPCDVSGSGGIRAIPPGQSFNTEEYGRIYENRFLDALSNPLSTFSIDVDSASYANMRRFIKNNQLPPRDAVRIEEMINYFDYDYPEPADEHPFSINTEMSSCPWNEAHDLLHIGLKGKRMKSKDLPPANLVFLLDVSGSMANPDKLPLLKSCFKLLVQHISEKDRISIVVYAGAAGLVLPCTPGNNKEEIVKAIDNLWAGGCTAGGAGIKLAYKLAAQNFILKGNNRVILATDGDFNVGVSSTSELTQLVEEKRKTGIFLTVLGFGTGNYKDHRMEQLADKGNGNYYYIDSILEGKKVFVDEMRATLFTIAKDVKIQVEFNPAKVKAYRLIGYENRKLKKEDFKDDTKDAGELGSGHTVTALYEIIPAGSEENIAAVDELKYQETKIKKEAFENEEIVTVKLRYKEPDGEASKLILKPVTQIGLSESSKNFRFSAAVAQFGMLLRDSEFKENSSFAGVLDLAKYAKGEDRYGYRSEFIRLVEICKLLGIHLTMKHIMDTKTTSGRGQY